MGTWKVHGKCMGDRCGRGKRSFLAKAFVYHSEKSIFVPCQVTCLLWAELLISQLVATCSCYGPHFADHIDLRMGLLGAVDVRSSRNKQFQISSANVLLPTNRRKGYVISHLYFAINTAFFLAPISWCILKSYCCLSVAQGMPFSFHEGCRETLIVWLSKTPTEDRWDLLSPTSNIPLH